MAKNKSRRLPLVVSLVVATGAVATAVYYKRQLDEPPYVNHGDPLMVIDNQTGQTVTYVPASDKK